MTDRTAPLSDRLEESVRKRAEMTAKYGFVPLSILRISRGLLHRSLYHLAKEKNRGNLIRREQSHRKTAAGRETSEERKRLGTFDAPYTEISNRETVSMMSGELVDFCLSYYLPDGGVFLDPFAGQGVQAQVAALRGVDYYGMDLVDEYVEFTNAVLEKYETDATITVVRGDSRFPGLEDSVGDFLFTSPPYWDVEFYSDDPEQLGLDVSYDEFMDGMRTVFAAWFPKLRPGATVVVNVNDIRRGGVFYPYHSDLIETLRDVGYVPHDIWIVDGLLGGLSRAFGVRRNEQGLAPKIHEYLLVFTTPEA